MILFLKRFAMLGAVIYGTVAFFSPILPIINEMPNQVRIEIFFVYWPVCIYAILTLLPNKALTSGRVMKTVYIVFAVAATLLASGMVAERLSTSFYRAGGGGGFRIGWTFFIYFSLCSGWISFWLHCTSQKQIKENP